MCAYEKFADIFMSSMAGQMTGLTREQFIQICKTKYPVEADFAKMAECLELQAIEQITRLQESVKPGEILAFAYPIDAVGSRTVH